MNAVDSLCLLGWALIMPWGTFRLVRYLTRSFITVVAGSGRWLLVSVLLKPTVMLRASLMFLRKHQVMFFFGFSIAVKADVDTVGGLYFTCLAETLASPQSLCQFSEFFILKWPHWYPPPFPCTYFQIISLFLSVSRPHLYRRRIASVSQASQRSSILLRQLTDTMHPGCATHSNACCYRWLVRAVRLFFAILL